MRTFNTLALGLLGAAVASASDVSSLTKDTFPDFVKENDIVLAECKYPTRPPLTNTLLVLIFLLSQSSQYVTDAFRLDIEIADICFSPYSHGGEFAVCSIHP